MGLKKLFNRITKGPIDKRHENGETRLYRAVRNGNVSEVASLLFVFRADPNVPDNHGLTPLHQAAYWGEKAIVNLLLQAGANPNADTGKGWTPLHSAAIAGGMKSRKAVIERLRRENVREDIVDKNGNTAAFYIDLWQKDAMAAAQMQDLMQKHQSNHPGPCAKCGKHHTFCGPTAPRH